MSYLYLGFRKPIPVWGTCFSSQVEKHQNDSTALWRLSPGTTGFASAKGNAFEAFLNFFQLCGSIFINNMERYISFIVCILLVAQAYYKITIWERIKQKDIARSFYVLSFFIQL